MTRLERIRAAVWAVTVDVTKNVGEMSLANQLVENLEREFELLGLVSSDHAGPQSKRYIELVIGAMYVAARRCRWDAPRQLIAGLRNGSGSFAWTFNREPSATDQETFLAAYDEWDGGSPLPPGYADALAHKLAAYDGWIRWCQGTKVVPREAQPGASEDKSSLKGPTLGARGSLSELRETTRRQIDLIFKDVALSAQLEASCRHIDSVVCPHPVNELPACDERALEPMRYAIEVSGSREPGFSSSYAFGPYSREIDLLRAENMRLRDTCGSLRSEAEEARRALLEESFAVRELQRKLEKLSRARREGELFTRRRPSVCFGVAGRARTVGGHGR